MGISPPEGVPEEGLSSPVEGKSPVSGETMLQKRVVSVENRTEETTEGQTWRIGEKPVL